MPENTGRNMSVLFIAGILILTACSTQKKIIKAPIIGIEGHDLIAA